MKKIGIFGRVRENPPLTKWIRMMKLTCLLLTIALVQVSAETYSQTKKLTLNLKDAPLAVLFEEIEKTSEFNFFYDSSGLDLSQKVTVTVEDSNIEAVLDMLFTDSDISYEIFDRYIILKSKERERMQERFFAQQQQGAVSGKVTDSGGQPLPGVTVVVKGTTQGTVTNADGNYSLSNIPENATLVFSFVGMLTQEISIEGRMTLTVVMEEEIIGLEEVIAIGYRAKKRGLITGSVMQIRGEELHISSETNLVKSLQGKISGLVISDRGGEPGAEATDFLIRGKSTLGDNSPLVVIDGIPQTSKMLSLMTSNDIKSISILKDASAAIYGARAANGVILVETKRGQKGKKAQIVFTSDYTFSTFTRVPEKENAYNSAIYINEIDKRYNRIPTIDENLVQQFKDGTFNPNLYADNNWMDLTYKNWAPRQNYNLYYTGSAQNIQYFISGDLLKEGAMYKSGDLDYKRYQYRANLDFSPVEFLNIGLDLTGQLNQTTSPSGNGSSIFQTSTWAAPWNINKFPNGLLGPGRVDGSSSVTSSTIDYAGWRENFDKTFGAKISFNLNMDWITKNLELSGYSFFNFENTDSKSFGTTYEYFTYNETIKDYESHMAGGGNNNLSHSNNNFRNQLHHIQLNYNRTLGDHGVSGFIAYEQMEELRQYLSASRKGLVSRTMPELFSGQQEGRTNDGRSFETGRINYFGALSYNYLEKYLLDFSLRYDGSFNFAPGKRFGLFPGLSAGWRISKEPFMNWTKAWLSDLKLRASWSKLGNDQVGTYQYLRTYALGEHFLFGDPAHYEEGIYQSNVPNPDITWETAKYNNIGFDAILWDELISISIDYFYEKRRKVLITRQASIPDYAALTLPAENLGKVDNTGFELNINHKNNLGRVNYHLGIVFSYNHNKIVYMDEPKNISEYRKKEGHPQDSWVVYKTDGIFNTQEEVDNTSAKLEGTKPGDIKYIDLDGDGEITGNDKYRKYTSPIPEIQYGINTGLGYKGFELNVFFQGQANAETYLTPRDMNTTPYKYIFESRWTEDNKYSDFPRAHKYTDFYNGNERVSDFWLYNASFIRLKNIEFAYNTPSKWKNFGLRFYLKGANLLTLDHIKHYDPEVNTEHGWYYPQSTRISTGFTIMF
jgi:TonB-dependent starch-binding outer membrane protein SusC